MTDDTNTGSGGVRRGAPVVPADDKFAAEILGRLPVPPARDGFALHAWAVSAIHEVRAALSAAAPVAPVVPAIPPGYVRASQTIDSLALYKTVCDLWAEANAVDASIGRPEVLMAKLAALRDSLGKETTGRIPVTGAPVVPVEPAAPGWIDFDDRRPAVGQRCLIWSQEPWEKAPSVKQDRWDEQHEAPLSWSSATVPIGEGWDNDSACVTHWMPEPEGPVAALAALVELPRQDLGGSSLPAPAASSAPAREL